MLSRFISVQEEEEEEEQQQQQQQQQQPQQQQQQQHVLIALHPAKTYEFAALYIINISIHITSIVNAYVHQHVSFQSAAHLLMPF